MDVNQGFIAFPGGPVTVQPMVDRSALARRLARLRRELGLSYAAFGELAGVSAQAAAKWCATGGISDETLERLVVGVNAAHPSVPVHFHVLRFGRERDTWMTIGRVLLRQYADGSIATALVRSSAPAEPSADGTATAAPSHSSGSAVAAPRPHPSKHR